MSGQNFLLPTPPLGYQGTPESEQASQAARFFGVDIWLEVAAPDVVLGQANYVTTASGDWAIATGREALRQSLLRRIITNPGEWKTKPDYGVGARLFVKGKNTASRRAELETRIRSQFAIDQRVESVDVVTITPLADGRQGVIISVMVQPRGRLHSKTPLAVIAEVI